MLVRSVEILLVEDNQGDIDLTVEALEESKVKNNLHVVTDGQQAIDFVYKKGAYASKPKPDLILLDLNLPKRSGIEVLQQIKEDKDLRRIPVIILTSSKDEQDVLYTYNLYANAFVQKPLDFNAFTEIVQKIESFWMSIVVLPDEKPK